MGRTDRPLTGGGTGVTFSLVMSEPGEPGPTNPESLERAASATPSTDIVGE